MDILGVYLIAGTDEIRVGSLIRDAQGLVRFDIDESYIEMGEYRPILSSSLLRFGNEADTIELLRAAPMVRGGRDVHAWFSNLLPEGALREIVMRGMPSGETTNFDVLKWLGSDLPGAVVVRQEDGGKPVQTISDDNIGSGSIRFALAGVQLKMSMLKQSERLTFPAHGVNGNIIAKLPSEKYRSLPEVEYASMMLAKTVGVTIPDMELVPQEAVSGLDPDLIKGGDTILAVNRFDRTSDGGRVHMEDFLQIIGEQADRKYSAANEETVLNIAHKLGGGMAPFLQGIRRIAVNILMGNTDAHLKNWSLWYPNPSEGELSPAYDIVAGYVYDLDNRMALRFRGSHDSSIMSLNRFQRAGEFCGVPVARTKKELKNVVEQAADEWAQLLQNLPMPDDFARKLIDRTKKLALTKEFEVSFTE